MKLIKMGVLEDLKESDIQDLRLAVVRAAGYVKYAVANNTNAAYDAKEVSELLEYLYLLATKRLYG